MCAYVEIHDDSFMNMGIKHTLTHTHRRGMTLYSGNCFDIRDDKLQGLSTLESTPNVVFADYVMLAQNSVLGR